MNENQQTTEPLSYLDKLRARELKDTPLKQEDDGNDDENREEDNGV